jgi:tetratricopeptide (TPR) repeat protein
MAVVWLATPAAPAAGQLPAPEVETWLPPGAEVVLKLSASPLHDRSWLIACPEHLSFLIEVVEGDRLLVASHDKNRRGWVRRDQVVPLEQSIAYFSRELARSPHDGDAYWTRGRLREIRGEDDLALADFDSAIMIQPARADFYLRRSLLLLRRHALDRALSDCDTAIKLEPKASGAWVVSARIRLLMGEHQLALADLDQALRLDPIKSPGSSPPAALAAPGLVLGVDMAKDEESRSSEPAANTAAEPMTPSGLLARGLRAFGQKEYDQAIADFTAAIRLDPKNVHAYSGRAQAWAKKHYRDRETADFTEAIRLDPKNVNYLVARGDSWGARGRHDEAIADYDLAIQTEPGNPALYLARGNEWRRHLKLDLALDDYNRAIQLSPNDIQAYICRALITKQRRQFDRAVAEFTELAKVSPDNAEIHRNLARILATCNNEQVRDGNRAVREAKRACELTSWQDPDCLDTLAAAYAELRDFSSAIEWETKAIGLLRKNVPSVLQRVMNFGGRRGVGFEDRLVFYKRNLPCRE